MLVTWDYPISWVEHKKCLVLKSPTTINLGVIELHLHELNDEHDWMRILWGTGGGWSPRTADSGRCWGVRRIQALAQILQSDRDHVMFLVWETISAQNGLRPKSSDLRKPIGLLSWGPLGMSKSALLSIIYLSIYLSIYIYILGGHWHFQYQQISESVALGVSYFEPNSQLHLFAWILRINVP